jgi:hypothetical protein
VSFSVVFFSVWSCKYMHYSCQFSKIELVNRMKLMQYLSLYNNKFDELYKQVEKIAFGEIFLPVLQRMQINLIFIDNVCILCLSCKVKMSKTTENNRKKALYSMVSSITSTLILLPFLTIALHEWGTRNHTTYHRTVSF